MVDFRKGITALALLVLFAGLAAAQVGGTGQVQLTCSTGVTVTPNLRNEGFTEQTGDITITCTGGSLGNLATAGTVIPQVNITIFYSTSVTSRLYGTSGTANPNEALLLIDEPGSGLQGPPNLGPNQPQTLCATPFTGCQAVTGYSGSNLSAFVPLPGGGASTTLSPNVYQGIASASVGNNAVTFFGVPVLPPTTTGSRVYRITNVRVNAVPLANQTQVYAQISVSPASSLGIINSQLAVGYVSTSLSTSNGATSLAQCASQTATKSYGGSLSFTEKFGTAFKTRIQAQSASLYAGQGIPGVSGNGSGGTIASQNIPGFPYNSESNFVFPLLVGPGVGGTAGLADFGTRLKATFTGVPSGVRIFVSTSNIINGSIAVTAPSPIGGSQANGGAGAISYAQLINGETTSDGSGGAGSAPPLLTNTDTSSPGGVPLVEVVLTGGAGTAVWEVMNTNPNSNETFTFGYYVGVASNTSTNTPLPGTYNVNLSYAPTTTSGAASNSLGIPRFSDTSTASKFLTINVCRTILLYPYLVNEIGLDTGIAIANTTQDPFGTLAQAGTCTLNFYPSDTTLAIPAAYTTATIKGGGTYTDTVSQRVPGFQGYMFAICNFQLAHGFAFISDLNVSHIAMGYLAIVLDDPANNSGVRWQHNTQLVENGAH
jgi:hypothetical protein